MEDLEYFDLEDYIGGFKDNYIAVFVKRKK